MNEPDIEILAYGTMSITEKSALRGEIGEGIDEGDTMTLEIGGKTVKIRSKPR